MTNQMISNEWEVDVWTLWWRYDMYFILSGWGLLESLIWCMSRLMWINHFGPASIFFIRTASIFYRSEALGGKHHQSIGASDILYCPSSALWSASLLSLFFPSSFCWPYKFQKYPVVHTQTRNRFPPFAAVETFPYLVVTGASAWPFNDHTGR